MSLPRSLGVFLLLLVLPKLATALDRNAFRFHDYDLLVRLDPAAQAISARGKLTVTNISNVPQKALALQISSTLEWRLVEAAGTPVQYLTQTYTTDIDHTGAVSEAIVTLPQALAPGASIVMEVGYSGVIPASAERLTRMGAPKDLAERSEWDQVSEFFTAVRGVGHVAWYPVSIEAVSLSDNRVFEALGEWRSREVKSSMRAEFCWIAALGADDDPELQLTVVTNGNLEGIGKRNTEISGDKLAATGCSTHRFADIGLTIPSFVVDEFEVLLRPTVTVYHLAGQERYAQAYADAVEAVQPFLTEWFGPKRDDKVVVVELDHAGAAPHESGAMLFTPLGSGSPAELQAALVHQAAHAAFPSTRPWMREGVAQFAQALWRERTQGRESALEFLRAQSPALVGAEKQACAEVRASEKPEPSSGQGNSSSRTSHGNDASSSRDTASAAASSSSSRKPTGSSTSCQGGRPLVAAYDEVYSRIKAMHVWWMLRDMAGDKALAQAISNYRAAEDKEPSYFQRLLRAESNRDLEWFFTDWVYRDRGLSEFRVESVYPRELLGGGYVVTVTVENSGGAGAEVPVRLIAPEGERQARLYVPRNERATTRIQIPTRPTEVVVNDGGVPESDAGNNQFPVK